MDISHVGCIVPLHYMFGVKISTVCCFQGFVSAVSQMRSFVPAIYDITVAIPKSSPAPTMLRLFKGQPSVVSYWVGIFKQPQSDLHFFWILWQVEFFVDMWLFLVKTSSLSACCLAIISFVP